MYDQKDVTDWILSGKPLISAKKPAIYTLAGLEFKNIHTGKTVVLSPEAALTKLIPLVFSQLVDNPTERVSHMAGVLDTLEYPEPVERKQVESVSPHKQHNFLSSKEVLEVENLLKLGFTTDNIIEEYDSSQAVISTIRTAQHRHTSASYIEHLRNTGNTK